MIRFRLYLLVGLTLTTVSVLVFLRSSSIGQVELATIDLKPIEVTLSPSQGEAYTVSVQLPQIVLRTPRVIYLGKSAEVDLRISAPWTGSEKIPAENLQEGSQIDLADLLSYVNVIYQARLDIGSVHTDPDGEMYAVISEFNEVNFHWDVWGESEAGHKGTLWLHLNLVDIRTGEVRPYPVLARRFDYESKAFLGGTVQTSNRIFSFVLLAGIVFLVLSIREKLRGFPVE